MKKILIAAAIFWAITFRVAAQDPLLLAPAELIMSDSFFISEFVRAVDFDNDGDDDILADLQWFSLGGGTAGLLFFENDGSGEFTLADRYLNSIFDYIYNYNIETGDIDGDGDEDVLFFKEDGISGAYTLVLLEQVSHMDFEITLEVPLTLNITNLRLLDFDFDDDLDVMLWDRWGTKVYWNRNNGAGGFMLHDSISLPILGNNVFFEDVDLDGDWDILARGDNALPGLFLYESQGVGSNYITRTITTERQSIRAIADLDTNGYNDLVLGIGTSDSGYIAYNDGGVFQLRPWLYSSTTQLLILDMNEDGLPDILWPNYLTDLVWYENLGSSVSQSPQMAYESDYGEGIGEYAQITDINKDGLMDVLAVYNGFAGWMENNGNQEFQKEKELLTERFQPFIGAINDLDLDGDQDVLFSHYSWYPPNSYNSPISWSVNTGGGSFQEQQPLIPEAYIEGDYFNQYLFGNSFPIQTADVDADGDADLVSIVSDTLVINPAGQVGDWSVVWYENQGNGQFSDRIDIGRASWSQLLRVADLDNDGDPDVVAWRYNENDISPFPGYDPGLVWFENQEGSFGPPQFFADDIENDPYSIFDIEGDGDQDIIQLGSLGITVFLNDGIQNFTEQNIGVERSGSIFEWRHLFADLDNDGLADLLIEDGTTEELVWYRNRGLDTIWTSAFIRAEGSAGFLTPGLTFTVLDLDGDNDQDVISSDFLSFQMVWNENLGGGEFAETAVISPVNFGYNHIYGEDMDNDGKIDLVAGPDYLNNFYWFRNLIGSSEIIRVQVYYDINEDGLKGSLEPGLDNQRVSIMPDAVTLVTQDAGMSYFYGASGEDYTVSWEADPEWHLTTASSYEVSLPQDTPVIRQFGIYPNNPVHAVKTVVSGNAFICLQEAPHHISLINQGTIIESGEVEFIKHPSLGFASATPDQLSVSGDTVRWEFEHLAPGEIRNIRITLDIPGPAQTGDTLQSETNVYLNDDAGGFYDTISTSYSTVVLCSYDPNDKQVQPLGVGDANQVLLGQTMSYTIRFQNTGNYIAFNVVLKDTIDDHLDLATFRVVNKSHPVQTTLDPVSREVTFYFPNIQLPDSTSDPEGSNGFVTYMIKQEEGLEEKVVVKNTAYIYFDQNPPIATNTVSNTLVETFSSDIPSAILAVEDRSVTAYVYPNPVRAQAVFAIEGLVDFKYDLELIDLSGRVLIEWNEQQGNTVVISMEGLASGFYLLNVKDGMGNNLGSLGLVKQ